MRVYFGVGQLNRKFTRPILTIGIFDGVHVGHKYIIKKVVEEARRLKGTSIVLTFYPHPYRVLKPKRYLPLLISLEHRLKLISEMGVDVCIVQGFTEKFSRIDKLSFVKKILFEKIHPLQIFVGKDFNFGKDGLGNVRLLKKLGIIYSYKVKEISPKILDGKVISSSYIRNLILKGKLIKASRFLGRPVSVFGKIVRGCKRGKILGYPTANIDYSYEVLPPAGVYAVNINLGKKRLFGVANIGFRPSFNKRIRQRKVAAEVHILDFHKRIYGKNIEIEFIKKIRSEKRFKKSSSLVRQIEKDIQKSKRIFKTNPRFSS
jgi:riboflavin kinase/FMN adenylyltransferase